MTTPLYARYIPPKKKSESQNESIGIVSSDEAGNSAGDKSESSSTRKRKREHARDGEPQRSSQKALENQSKPNAPSAASSLSSKDKSSKTNNTTGSRKDSNRKRRGQLDEDAAPINGNGLIKNDTANEKPQESSKRDDNSGSRKSKSKDIPETEARRRKKKKSQTKEPKGNNGESREPVEAEEDSKTTKHSTILSKFEKSIKHQPKELQAEPEAEPQEVHGLVPIPLPEQTVDVHAPTSISTLPPWISKPVVIPADHRTPFRELQLDSGLVERLDKNGFKSGLPIQSGMLPLLLPSPTQHPGDLCVSAHTGSGKTLGYVLPIVQSLPEDVVTHLRALIIVPTRELVEQVRETMELCSAGNKLRVGTAVGSNHFAVEQSMLIEKSQKYDPSAYKLLKKQIERVLSFEQDESDFDDENINDNANLHDFSSLVPDHIWYYVWKVDILISTPGRVVEHLKQTKGFSLTNLKWLVIDEADRLLDASFQDWLNTLMTATEGPELNRLPCPAEIMEFIPAPMPRSIRKVILSATMTRDLDKLGGLKLKNPKMIAIEGFEELKSIGNANTTELPSTLSQFGTPVGDGSEKPLYLLALLKQILQSNASSTKPISNKNTSTKNVLSNDKSSSDESSSSSSENSSSETNESRSSSDSSSESLEFEDIPPKALSNVLIFTSGNEAAHRLSRLLVLLTPEYESQLATITKSNASKSTRKTLSSFRSSKLRVLVATERASRGLDLPNLENVVNYDIPHNITSYIHRVGRTARAGRQGSAWTLVADREGAWFWKELAKTENIQMTNGGIIRKRFDLSGLGSEVRNRYTEALRELEEDVKGE